MPARMKSLIGEYFGQSSVLVGKKTKGGVGWRRSTPTVVIGQRQRGGGIWGHTEGEENEPRQEGRRGGEGGIRDRSHTQAVISLSV